jgi:hypothetical protein
MTKTSKLKRPAPVRVQPVVSVPRLIPKERWWKCTCHGKLQKHFYPMIVGENKLCTDGSAKLIWDGTILKAR